ncbi:MAG: chromosomal replication initiator protein DnaA [Nitrospirota bacterium]|nr:chromosomal replication initiator protein DnaA [Nitrospirota bacterium]
MQDLWQNALKYIDDSEGSNVLEGVREIYRECHLEQEGNHLTLIVPNGFVSRLVSGRHQSSIVDACSSLLNRDDLEFSIRISEEKKSKKNRESGRKDLLETPLTSLPIRNSQEGKIQEEEWANHLIPRYLFENYVVGESNRFAHAAAYQVSENPGKSYNPFYIYGGVGLGKTHLVNAVGNAIFRKNPSKKILYVTTESFLNEMVNAIKFNKMNEFRERYRTIDILIMDDIQFLSKKERTQEEFFHTFNTLFESGKQIILTSDCAPNEILTLEERLKSRFSSGLIADIQIPDFETKVAILTDKMKQEGITLSEDVIFFLASSIKSNIRELEGAMIRLGAYQTLMGKSVTIDVTRRLLSNLIQTQTTPMHTDLILNEVAAFYKVSPKEIRSKKRNRSIALARQVAIYLLRDLTQMSFPEIGREMGGRDHSTAIYSFKTVDENRDSDSVLSRDIEILKKKLLQSI